MSIARISEENVEGIIRGAERPVALDFWMDNCPPCNALAPTLEAVAESYEEQVKTFQVKVDEDSPILQTYGIKGMPTVLFFEEGELAGRLAGRIRKQDLEEAFEEIAAAEASR